VNLGLEGKVALVCGGSRGLGRALAEELAAEGASLALCARTPGPLERAAAEIELRHGAAVLSVAADLGVRGEPTRVVGLCQERLGRVDVLVANTGGPVAGNFDTLAAADWENACSLLLGSVVELCAAVLPAMRVSGWGRILAITSIAAREPVENLMLSNSLRPAVAGFAHALAREVARDGVTVNTILPGFTNTERLRELHASSSASGEPASRAEQQIPLGRFAEPHEFAALGAFLVSERASYITGASFAVDGGWLRGV
jgi:3-oxoacyl-[acyl-carrier protein] reductase